jgi:hypothetical protein
MSDNLRSKVIRLAHQNPELRPHLLPLLVGNGRVASEGDFTDGYVEAMLFSSDDEDGRPLGRNYNARDIDPASRRKIEDQCKKFLNMPGVDDQIDGRYEEAGRDFWLTRNETGAGFRDGDWPDPAEKVLYTASKKFPVSNVYVDGGVIFVD